MVAANIVPKAEPSPELMNELNKDEPPEHKLTPEERQKLLIEVFEKDGGLDMLKEWLADTALKA